MNLAVHAENCVALMDVVPSLRAVLERHAGDVEVVRNCTGCFMNLAVHAENCVALMGVVPVLRAVLDRHAGDVEAARLCREVLKALGVVNG
jgi:hypothetical protein